MIPQFPAHGTPNAPKEIYLMAEGCVVASNLVAKSIRTGSSTTASFQREEFYKIAPTMVLYAFSVELYLKCLHEMDTGSAPHSHNLLDLYNKLQPATQNSLKKTYEEFLKTDPTALKIVKNNPTETFSIEDVANRSGEAFVIFRYIYELRSGSPYRDDSYLIGRAAKRLIIEREPTWNIVQNIAMPQDQITQEPSAP